MGKASTVWAALTAPAEVRAAGLWWRIKAPTTEELIAAGVYQLSVGTLPAAAVEGEEAPPKSAEAMASELAVTNLTIEASIIAYAADEDGKPGEWEPPPWKTGAGRVSDLPSAAWGELSAAVAERMGAAGKPAASFPA